MASFTIDHISNIVFDPYGFTTTLCAECDDTITGIAYADDSSPVAPIYCEPCGIEIEHFQAIGQERY